MNFIADFHVHSKYSRATAKNLDLEHLYIAAQLKGIAVVGTGDFTHPGWFSEIREKLEPAEPGLFKLKDDIANLCDPSVPRSCRNRVRFILTTEISNIYKKKDKTRKNHNLVFLPHLDSAFRFNAKLSRIGNIASDGRPILGLDARNLLEILLETNPEGFLVPAHIWTPWFSLLGSKSGFDRLDQCFDDLTPHIFAVETGLSSDPAMNWQVSGLDGLTLVSNSDAHSPFNLGREANRFNAELSYSSIRSALETGDPEKFLGTFEFYPEEGKYHFDGHRKCNLCYHPKDSLAKQGICPVCNKPLTLGVLFRVMELADREEGILPERTHPFVSIIPLTDILAGIFMVGPQSKKVAAGYAQATEMLGSEFVILHELSIDEINRAGIPLLGEAVLRMRTNRIHVSPGYDGEYGKVHIFDAGERRRLLGQQPLFAVPDTAAKNTINKSGDMLRRQPQVVPQRPDSHQPDEAPAVITEALNKEQQRALIHSGGPLLILAGPGTGKTRTLTHKIAFLIKEKNVLPQNILALTFTNKAALEMKQRLTALCKEVNASLPLVATFHSLCFRMLSDYFEKQGLFKKSIIDDHDRRMALAETYSQFKKTTPDTPVKPAQWYAWVISAKQQLLEPGDDLSPVVGKTDEAGLDHFTRLYRMYEEILTGQGLMDYEDLILQTVKLLENHAEVKHFYQQQYRHLFIDEYQDLNHGQYRIVRALSFDAQDLCVIGDPDQAIYGFRGSDRSYFNRFMQDFPTAAVITLNRNFRSTETILEGSFQVIRNQAGNDARYRRVTSGIKGVESLTILASATEKAEAVAIGKAIEKTMGGIGFHSMDFNAVDSSQQGPERSFSDFAVLYRTRKQSAIIADVLGKANIPYRIASRAAVFEEKGLRELISMFKLVEGTGAIPDFERLIRISGLKIGNKAIQIFKTWHFTKRCPLSDTLSQVRRFPIPGMASNDQLKLDRFVHDVQLLREETRDLSVLNRLKHLARAPLIAPVLKRLQIPEERLRFLFDLSEEYASDPRAFISAVSLQTDADAYDPRIEKVTLMTLHASKGLEFPVVFIAGCENDLIPHLRPGDSKPDPEEERRLFYVGMTRAKDHLYLSWAKKRKIYGKTLERIRSPFIADIEERLLAGESSGARRKKEKQQKQLPLFS
jgi:DNA helicase II / ATP-dependent DNA helicase PcrA